MRIGRLIGWIFAGIGAVLLVLASVMYQRDMAFVASARSATGEVVELIPSWSRDGNGRSSRSYAGRIRFVTDSGRSVDFVDGMSTAPARYREGDEVRVLYDPARPSRAFLDDFWGRHGFMAIDAGLGLLFAALGCFFVAREIAATRRAARLRREGRPIEADFLHVFADTGLLFNGRRPYRVAAQASDPATGLLRRFDSLPIWVDPTARLQGRKVRVLLDPAGRDYLVDLSGVVDDRDHA